MSKFRTGDYLTITDGPYLVIPKGSVVTLTHPDYGKTDCKYTSVAIELDEKLLVTPASKYDVVCGTIIEEL